MLARVRSAYESFLELVVILLMAALALEVITGVAFRSLGQSLVWYDEVASILLAWLTFYGSALAAAKRAHIGCPEVMVMLPPRVRLAFRVLAEILVILFFGLIAWVGYSVLDVLAMDNLVSLPQVSVKYTQSVIPISALLILVAEILNLPEALKGALDGGQPGAAAGESSH